MSLAFKEIDVIYPFLLWSKNIFRPGRRGKNIKGYKGYRNILAGLPNYNSDLYSVPLYI